MDKSSVDIIKEKIKVYASQLDGIRAEVNTTRAKLTELEDNGKQCVGALKTLQALVSEFDK